MTAPEPRTLTVEYITAPSPEVTKATAMLVATAIRERQAEEACRNRPWEDRAAWLAYTEALMARRAAVDALRRVLR